MKVKFIVSVAGPDISHKADNEIELIMPLLGHSLSAKLLNHLRLNQQDIRLEKKGPRKRKAVKGPHG